MCVAASLIVEGSHLIGIYIYHLNSSIKKSILGWSVEGKKKSK